MGDSNVGTSTLSGAGTGAAVGSAFGPVGTVVGGVVGGAAGLIGGLASNSSSAKSVQKQMDFQERMSSTSYQRAVTDLKAAGLNPALAYMTGGESSPSGASYTAQNPAAGLSNLGGMMASIDSQEAAAASSNANTAKTLGVDSELARQLALTSATAADVNKANEVLTKAKTTYTRLQSEGQNSDNARKAAIAEIVRPGSDYGPTIIKTFTDWLKSGSDVESGWYGDTFGGSSND